ncbi:MAG: hypothetical protein AAF720_01320 [Pseudomonadota bacterium]
MRLKSSGARDFFIRFGFEATMRFLLIGAVSLLAILGGLFVYGSNLKPDIRVIEVEAGRGPR